MATRLLGARDFVAANVTPEGVALGFVTAEVDTGAPPAKWYSLAFPGNNAEEKLAPGLPKIEGWRIQEGLLPTGSGLSFERRSPG